MGLDGPLNSAQHASQPDPGLARHYEGEFHSRQDVNIDQGSVAFVVVIAEYPLSLLPQLFQK
jgi:hypothetical protein